MALWTCRPSCAAGANAAAARLPRPRPGADPIVGRLSRLCLAFSLLAAGLVPTAAAQAPPAPRPEDAVVLIRSANSLRSSRGSGFLIGDGSWVVTASHVVTADLGKGKRLGDRTAFVYSPWTGRPEEARLVGVDVPADIALLRLAAPGLPALAVAGLESQDAAEALARLKDPPLRLLGFPLAYGEDTVASQAVASHNDSRLREIARRGQTSLAVLGACPDVQPGWSGGPIIERDSGAVVAVFHSLFRPRPDSPEGYPAGSLSGYLGELLKRSGAGDPAAFLKPPSPTRPRSPRAAERLAHELRSLSWAAGGKLVKATEEQREILKSEPADAMSHLELGRLLLLQKQYRAALAALREAVRLAPACVTARILLGKALHLEFEPKKARAELAAAMELAPDEADAPLVLAEVLGENQELDAAESVLRSALARIPEHPVLQSRLGELLMRRAVIGDALGASRRKEGARLLAESAALAGSDPSLIPVAIRYALYLEGEKRYGDAEDVYQRIRRLDPQNPLGPYHLARLFLLQNRVEEAQIHLNAGFRIRDLSDAMVEAYRALQLKINERGGGH